MRTSDLTKEIMPLLADIQKEAHRVTKSAKNTAQKYAYATLEDFMKPIEAAVQEAGLVMTMSVSDHEIMGLRNDRVSAKLTLTLRLTEPDSGEWVEISAAGEGIDIGDKSTYKAITGARKYALALMFGLITTDEPEADESSDFAAAPVAVRKTAPILERSEPRPAPKKLAPPSGSDYNNILNNINLQARTEQSGQYTNFIVSGMGVKLRDVLSEQVLAKHARKSSEPYDQGKGMWIPGGEISFGQRSFAAFIDTLSKSYGTPSHMAQEVPMPSDEDYEDPF